MNPVSHARDPGTFVWRRGELNVVLAFSGFDVRLWQAAVKSCFAVALGAVVRAPGVVHSA